MKPLSAVLLIGIFLWTGAIFAKDIKKDKPSAQPAPSQQDRDKQERDHLITNVNKMRNQELRVALLQQLLSEEVLKLRNTQESFCQEYKLDIEKFRKGLYRYDENEKKFIEAKTEEGKK